MAWHYDSFKTNNFHEIEYDALNIVRCCQILLNLYILNNHIFLFTYTTGPLRFPYYHLMMQSITTAKYLCLIRNYFTHTKYLQLDIIYTPKYQW